MDAALAALDAIGDALRREAATISYEADRGAGGFAAAMALHAAGRIIRVEAEKARRIAAADAAGTSESRQEPGFGADGWTGGRPERGEKCWPDREDADADDGADGLTPEGPVRHG